MKISFLLFIFLLFNFWNTTLHAQTDKFSIEYLIGKKAFASRGSIENLNTEAYQSFLKMKKEASLSKIHIQIVSGYRSFYRQQQIFDRKFLKYQKLGLSKIQILNKIIEYSTIPGTSRHHWGTDIDIIQKVPKMPKNLLVVKNYEDAGAFCAMKEWMDKNAHRYGFYLVYTNDINRSGFKYEPWHYTYKPLSKIMLDQFLDYEKNKLIFNEITKSNSIIDSIFFKKYIKKHIKGINYQILEP